MPELLAIAVLRPRQTRSTESAELKKHWYHVPEAWLILTLLLWAIGGSACLITAALEYPDAVVADQAAVHATR